MAKSSKQTPPVCAPAPGTSIRVGSPLTAEAFARLYQAMLRCRLVEARIASLRDRASLAGTDFAPAGVEPFARRVPGNGREAMVVGSIFDLLPDDLLFSTPRSFAAHSLKGAQLASLFLLPQSRRAAPRRSPLKPSSRHSLFSSSSPEAAPNGGAADAAANPDAAVAAHISLATGTALACKLRRHESLVTALAWRPPVSLDDWREALRFAAVHKLPVIYVVDNRWGVNSGAEPPELGAGAGAYGIPGIVVEASDVVAVFRVCQEAREKARQGYGPTLVECRDFCLRSRAGTGDDPLAAMQGYLEKKGLWSEAWRHRITAEIEREIGAAVKTAAKCRHHDAQMTDIQSFMVGGSALDES